MVPGQDHLVVDGKKVRLPEVGQRKVYALYKPKNCITSLSDPEGRRTIVDYFPRKSRRFFQWVVWITMQKGAAAADKRW